MTAPYDLIVFDYDGVVADSELLNNLVLSELLTECGLATSLDEALSTYMGKRWLDCLPLIEERMGGACPDHFHGEWTRRCHERAATELGPVTGFVDFLASRGERRCIASSSPVGWILQWTDLQRGCPCRARQAAPGPVPPRGSRNGRRSCPRPRDRGHADGRPRRGGGRYDSGRPLRRRSHPRRPFGAVRGGGSASRRQRLRRRFEPAGRSMMPGECPGKRPAACTPG